MGEFLDVETLTGLLEDYWNNTEVRAVTPHGSYTFAITSVTEDEDVAILHLVEVARRG